MDSNVLDSINNIYKSRGYFEIYGTDLLIAIIIIYVLLLGSSYFYILTHKKNIESNWPEKRCNPLYIPLSGFIVKNKNQTILEATSENFTHCTRNILATIANDAFAPIYYIFNVLNQSFSEITSSINSVRAMFNKIRTNIGETASNISGRTLNVAMPIVHQSVHSRDSLSRIHGIATTAVYQLFGLFITTFSIFKFFKDVLIGLLVIMAAAIVALWVLSFIPFIGIPAGIAAGTSTLLYIAILVPFLIVIILISIIFKYNGGGSPPNVPGKSSCFDKNTLIEMNDGSLKKISNINIGDILKDNNKVTATMISTIGNNKMYKIDNILVTGCHKIKINNNWYTIENYSNEIQYDYKEKYVYCINTENKIINIDNKIFMDWDELDEKEINKLNIISDYNINRRFNNGVSENTMIDTLYGNKKIKELNIGDKIGIDNYILAKIEVLPDELHILEQNVDDEKYLCTLNLIKDISFMIDDVKECKKLYQIKTTMGYYFINKNKISDYDSVIEESLQ